MNFSNQVVLITGGSRGIGAACARQFASQGARVAMNYRTNRQAAEKTKNALPGGPHEIVQTDISDSQAAFKMTETVIQKMGKIDILVNSAGIYELHSITKQSFEEWKRAWDRAIGINLLGAAHVTFAVVKEMIKRGGGRIINISSRGAFRGEPHAPAYGASKAGLNALSQSLAQALAPHRIYVYAVAPGFVDTDMAAEPLSGPLGEQFRRESPMGRVATPEEVARTVLFLASEGSEYMTGSIVDINGASYLRT